MFKTKVEPKTVKLKFPSGIEGILMFLVSIGSCYLHYKFIPVFYRVIDESYREIAATLFPDNAKLSEWFRLFSWLWLYGASVIILGCAFWSIWNRHKSKERLKQIPDVFDIEQIAIDELKEIRGYYMMSKYQASKSFALTLLMCFSGFFMVGVTIFCAIYTKGDFVLTLIPATGAVIVEVIAGTALLVYKKSLDQINHCYDVLVQNQRVLLAIEVAKDFPVNKRHDFYREIILQNMRSGMMQSETSDGKSSTIINKARIRKKAQE